MKKINLRGLQEKLSASELKNILGGSDPFQCNITTGTCGVNYPLKPLCGCERDFVWKMAGCDENGENCQYNWCCDSCGSSSYCG